MLPPIAIKALLVVGAVVVLEIPAMIAHSELKTSRADLTALQKKYNDDEQSIGVLKGQLATSQSDLAASKRANSDANASIDGMKRAADAAVAEEAAFRLKVAAQQATYGKVIQTRDTQIAALKAQGATCEDAIADLRAGQ
jgi:septal ring factor EnvC (AmiA/AmiB activator)